MRAKNHIRGSQGQNPILHRGVELISSTIAFRFAVGQEKPRRVPLLPQTTALLFHAKIRHANSPEQSTRPVFRHSRTLVLSRAFMLHQL